MYRIIFVSLCIFGIIAVFGLMLFPVGSQSSGPILKTKVQLHVIEEAIRAYYAEFKQLPPNQAALEAHSCFRSDLGNVWTDAWGQPIQFTVNTGRCEVLVFSFGGGKGSETNHPCPGLFFNLRINSEGGLIKSME